VRQWWRQDTRDESIRESLVVRETHAMPAYDGVAMTQSQRGPMDSALETAGTGARLPARDWAWLQGGHPRLSATDGVGEIPKVCPGV